MRTSDEISFGQLVGSYRTLRTNISQKTLANWLGISGVAYHNWEIDESKPSAKNLQRLLEVFLEHGLFTPRKEIDEARALWKASKVNVVFDEVWTNALTNRQHHLQPAKKAPVDAPPAQSVKMGASAEVALPDHKIDQRSAAKSSSGSEISPDTSPSDSHRESALHFVDTSPKKEVSSPSPDALSQGTMETDPGLEGEDPMEKLRRDMLQLLQRLGLVVATTMVPAIGQQDLITEVGSALYPSSPGDKELQLLEQKIRDYWQDRYNARIAQVDLILHAEAYVREVITLLKRSLLPSTRTRLCACLSQGTLLIGASYHSMGQFQKAREYYQTTVEAAYEANNNILQAMGWRYAAFSWVRSNDANWYKPALDSILKACGFASLESDIAVQCWMEAGSAEIYARHNERDACLEALKRASKLDGYEQSDWSYLDQFDHLLMDSYRGTCLQELYRPGNPETYVLLEEAKQALQAVLSEPNTAVLQRSFYVADMALIHAREGEVEAACSHARQIIEVVDTSQSKPLQQRLLAVHTHLKPYADVETVKELDREIMMVLLG